MSEVFEEILSQRKTNLHKGPKFLKAIELASLAVLEGLLLEVAVEIRSEFPLEPIAVEPKQALQSIPAKGQRNGLLQATIVTRYL